MATVSTIDTAFGLMAQVVQYPTPALPQQAQACVAALKDQRPRAARPMQRFEAFVRVTPLDTIEELYTATFELRPVCFPYIGFQLFGETYKRGAFLAALSARFREAGCDAGTELPDHLSVVLRYLALVPDADLVTEGLLPALQRMIDQLDGNPYRDALQAIRDAVRLS